MATDLQIDPVDALVAENLAAREGSLSVYAARSALSRGRERPEPPSPIRTEFQRDRDRILHSKSFRRLKHKTQVFIAPLGDHYVTRMTHTLEVAQVARTIARALTLNEDLTEAISLAHDIGHACFGHAGEEALAECLGDNWRHNEQGRRVVEVLENDGRGLNLTWETREGIEKSSKVREDIFAEAWGTASTLEGQVLKIADAVAYLNHDIKDAVRAGVLTEEGLPEETQYMLGRSHGERINTIVTDIVRASWPASGLPDPSGRTRIDPGVKPLISMSAPVRTAVNNLRDFMFENVYLRQDREQEVTEAKEIIYYLFNFYRQRSDMLPAGWSVPTDPIERQAVDFISGMTDIYALRTAAELGCTIARGPSWETRLT
ncbi:MAG: deoxyguanosinetriphosphate triphosphohydrolase [Chloroflexota bacterium]|nr:deoxyguanosinetriphosphate triphosphohydrolase [Chloroflexota bacterium]